MKKSELIRSIYLLAKDFREDDFGGFNEEHINYWIDQFKESDQIPILKEMKYILENDYVSKVKAAEFIESILTDSRVNLNFKTDFNSIKFLDIQRKGSSQKELLELVNEIAGDRFGIDIEECGSTPVKYIYVDDCLFSGNTVFYDIDNWVKTEDISNTEIIFFFLGVYSFGEHYLTKRLKPLLNKRNIKFTIWRLKTFENRPWKPDAYQCCWPDAITNNKALDVYIEELKDFCEDKGWEPRLFHPGSSQFDEKLFSSLDNRLIVEKAFLEAGLQIRGFCKFPKRTMRPLGYENLESLGFGSMFITYRNIANNCPLALWWGGPNEQPPLDKWYPLFPRKVNESATQSVHSIFF